MCHERWGGHPAGGGVFLAPLLLLAGWERTREVAAVSAPFIQVNSIAALSGLVLAGQHIDLPIFFPVWLRYSLGVVLLAAAVKFRAQGSL